MTNTNTTELTQEFTPEQKIKWIMLDLALKQDYIETLEDITADNVDDLYDEFHDDLQDVKNEVRSGTVETDLPHEYSRNYESKAVAGQSPDGTWVGWTYWHGAASTVNQRLLIGWKMLMIWKA